MSRNPPFAVKRAYGDGSVRVAVTLSASHIGEHVAIQGAGEIDTAEARALAAALIAEADRVDAATAKKAAAEARREAYRQREIAAGRMKVMSPAEFFGGGRA